MILDTGVVQLIVTTIIAIALPIIFFSINRHYRNVDRTRAENIQLLHQIENKINGHIEWHASKE